MTESLIRTEMVLGRKAVSTLRQARVAVFGLGGVGGYAAEALARSGVGTLDLIDHDTICESNLNRQIIALHSTLGMRKTDAAAQRIHDISPETAVHCYPVFYLPETKEQFDFGAYDYIVDAIDTVTAKIDIILEAQKHGVSVISSMGCGNRTDPLKLTVTDIYRTSGDPLAKVMRRELKKRNVRKLQVVYSTEKPLKPLYSPEDSSSRRGTPGSTAVVPSAAGLIIASRVILELTSFDPENRE